jgi:hypothetical protein
MQRTQRTHRIRAHKSVATRHPPTYSLHHHTPLQFILLRETLTAATLAAPPVATFNHTLARDVTVTSSLGFGHHL